MHLHPDFKDQQDFATTPFLRTGCVNRPAALEFDSLIGMPIAFPLIRNRRLLEANLQCGARNREESTIVGPARVKRTRSQQPAQEV